MKYIVCFIHLCFALSIAFSQKKATISGFIRDIKNGEAIIGASVYIPEIGSGMTTNVYGFYSISLVPGKYTLIYRYIGYKTIEKEIELEGDVTINFEMQGEDISLAEVVVEGEKKDINITSIEMSVEKIDAKTIQKMPAFLGEPDIVNSLVLLPGVTNIGEGSNGFNVRGGHVDENLILLDGAPVYSSSHLFGFFSIFNSDAIQDLKLYKGGIPPEYGGRLSSVLEIHQKEGNSKKFTGSAGVSSIASKFTLEGPLVKDRMSFIASGRISYVGYLAKFSSDDQDNNIYFYDLNGKMNYTLGEKDRIFLSGYYGNDVVALGGDFDFGMKWGNGTTTLRWNHLFNHKIFSNLSLIYSKYDYVLGSTNINTAFDWKSEITNYNIKYDFTFYANSRNTIKYGVSALEYQFQPGKLLAGGDVSALNEIKVPEEKALESGIYFSNEQRMGARLTLLYGLRYSSFINHGRAQVYEYETGSPRSGEDPNSFDGANPVVGSRSYDGLDVIKIYDGIEPRFSVNYLLNDRSSVKASYNRTKQYIHLVANTTAPLPISVWKPSGTYVRPSAADQVAVGYFRNFSKNKFEFSVESYYKRIYDLLEYTDGADLILNPYVEQELIHGNGQAYGLEFQIEKKVGKTNGWISYTLARTERKVPGINNDQIYPSNYDKTHDISVVFYHEISKKFELSAIFGYATGKPITYPDGRYEFEEFIIPNYSNRNGARMSDFHRLDLGLNWRPDFNPEAKIKGKWNLSVYNVYGRRNAFSISFRQNADYPTNTEAYRVSVLGSPVPSLGYSVKF